MNETTRNLLEELRAGLEAVYGKRLRGVYLYGSYARGEQEEGSDADVAVVLSDFDDPWLEIRRTSEMASALSLRYGISLSLYRIREAEWNGDEGGPLLRNIRQQAIAHR